MSPGTLDRLRERQNRARARSKGWGRRVVLMSVPILLLVLGFFGYRYYVIHTTIAEVRRIVAAARAYNGPSEEALEVAIAWNSDGYSKGYPTALLSRLAHSAQIALALGTVLEEGGRPANAADPTTLPKIDLQSFDAGVSTERGLISRDGLVLVALINRQCDAIEDRVGVCEKSFGECLLAGDLVMLRGARGLGRRRRPRSR